MNGKPPKMGLYNNARQAFLNAPLGLNYGMNASTLTMQMHAALQQFAQALFQTSASMQSFANSMQALGFDPDAFFPFMDDDKQFVYGGSSTASGQTPEIRVLKCGNEGVQRVVGDGIVRRLDRIESLEERLGKQGTRVL